MTNDTQELLERLRAIAATPWFNRGSVEVDCAEAADTIEALSSALAAYEKAIPLPATNPVCGFGTGDVQVVGNAFSVKRVREWCHAATERCPGLEQEIRANREALAAAERERDDLRGPVVHALASLAAAISLLERGGKKAAPSDKMFEQMLTDYRNALERARAALPAKQETSQ